MSLVLEQDCGVWGVFIGQMVVIPVTWSCQWERLMRSPWFDSERYLGLLGGIGKWNFKVVARFQIHSKTSYYDTYLRGSTFWSTYFTSWIWVQGSDDTWKSYLLFPKIILVVQTNERLSFINFPKQSIIPHSLHFVLKSLPLKYSSSWHNEVSPLWNWKWLMGFGPLDPWI